MENHTVTDRMSTDFPGTPFGRGDTVTYEELPKAMPAMPFCASVDANGIPCDRMNGHDGFCSHVMSAAQIRMAQQVDNTERMLSEIYELIQRLKPLIPGA